MSEARSEGVEKVGVNKGPPIELARHARITTPARPLTVKKRSKSGCIVAGS